MSVPVTKTEKIDATIPQVQVQVQTPQSAEQARMSPTTAGIAAAMVEHAKQVCVCVCVRVCVYVCVCVSV